MRKSYAVTIGFMVVPTLAHVKAVDLPTEMQADQPRYESIVRTVNK
jgi:hypothetical protein